MLWCFADVATSYLDMIQNKDITADCDKATGNCNIVIQDFPIQLETPCKAGDCVSDKNPTLNSGGSPALCCRPFLPVPPFCEYAPV